MNTRQRGFALVAALILLIIFSFIGMNSAHHGLVAAQIAHAGTRFSAVENAADGELLRLSHHIVNADTPIVTDTKIENTAPISSGTLTTQATITLLASKIVTDSDGTRAKISQYLIRVNATAKDDTGTAKASADVQQVYQRQTPIK